MRVVGEQPTSLHWNQVIWTSATPNHADIFIIYYHLDASYYTHQNDLVFIWSVFISPFKFYL